MQNEPRPSSSMLISDVVNVECPYVIGSDIVMNVPARGGSTLIADQERDGLDNGNTDWRREAPN